MLTAGRPGESVLISVDPIPLGGCPILSRFVRKGAKHGRQPQTKILRTYRSRFPPLQKTQGWATHELTIDVDFSILIGGKYLPSLPGFSWRAAPLRAQLYPFGSFAGRLLVCRQGKNCNQRQRGLLWQRTAQN
jgi:hypothetical protein